MSAAGLIPSLSANPAFAGCSFEPLDVAGLEAVVARLVPPSRSVSLWRAARDACPSGFWPILTDDDQVHPGIRPLAPIRRMRIDAARAARERAVRSSAGASQVLDAIADAAPQPEPYVERDSFLEDLESATISLVIVAGSELDAVRPFSPDGEGSSPRNAELLAMLASWRRRYGAAALYADGHRLELDVRRPPRDRPELIALARDFFLLSQGTREGFGLEDPARLLRRLMSDRWVVWWYGTLSD